MMPGAESRADIRGRIAAALLLACGFAVAVAMDWRPLEGRALASPIHGIRRPAADPRLALPARVHLCEFQAATVCGTWTLQPGGFYRGRWEDGATGTIHVIDLDATGIVARRVDDAPRRLTAVYEGYVTERTTVLSGSVRWSTGRQSRAGTWDASWDADPHPSIRQETQTK